MRIVILSDTHGNYPLAAHALDEAGEFDCVVHLGDEVDDACVLEQIIGRSIVKVAGNCDLASAVPREQTLMVGGRKIFIAHGDRYRVKCGLTELHKKALLERAHVVLYGHSHRAAIDTIDGILFVNPGCLNRQSSSPSCAILTIGEQGVQAEIVPLTDGQQPQPQL